jgi:hypothetical protein
MNELNYPETTKYVIVHDNEIFDFFIIEPQNCISTGKPYMEIFDSEEEAKQAFPQVFLQKYPTFDTYGEERFVAISN